MLVKKRHPFIATLTVMIFIFVFLFDSSSIDISIKNAAPLLALPLITGYSIFASFWRSVVAGFVTGAVVDSFASGSYSFNTIIFLVFGAVLSYAANNLFNKNIHAAVAVSVIIAVIYFVVRWLVLMAFGTSVQNSTTYLLSYALPSAIYSAAFIFIFFYIFRAFDRKRNN